MKIARTSEITATEPRLLAWDTEFWGIRIAQTDHPDVDQWALDNTVGLMCMLADPDEPEVIQQAEEHGFRYVDTRVELELPAQHIWNFNAPGRIWVCRDLDPASPVEEVDQMAALARRAHRITRFYADPRFDRDRCDDLYEGWFRNSVNGWADAVLLVGNDGPAGYVTIHVNDGVGSIGLIAVEDDFRGQGFGLALTYAAHMWAQEYKAAERMTVVTQGRNAAALATFQKAGFKVRSTKLWLHRWSDA